MRSGSPYLIRSLLRAILGLSLFALASTAAPRAFAQTATTTSLAVTSGGSPVSTIASGNKVTLTATVSAGSVKLTQGQVKFCDGQSTYCTDVHLLGIAQLTTAGQAQLYLHPLPGNFSYKAEFVGTPKTSPGYTASESDVATLTVTGVLPTVSTLTQSGVSGNYTLTASEWGFTKQSPLVPTGNIAIVDTTTGNSVLASSMLAPAGTGPEWVNSSNPAVGNEPGGIVAADFNRDGNMDLAVGLNEDTNSVTVLLGDGTGNFNLAPTTSLADRWIPVLTADFNQDGIPDLVVSNGSSLMILLGNGDGTFTPANGQPLSVGSGFGGLLPIQTADLNGDGIPDLVVADSEFDLHAFLGNGDGTFISAASSPLSSQPEIVSMVVGDFNGDGIQDVAFLNDAFSLSISVYFGNGDGTFSPGPSTPVGPFAGDIPISLAAADFNGDGNLDLTVPNEAASSLVILLGSGDGTFRQPTGSPIPVGAFPEYAAVGDFNGDGIPDILLAQGSEEGSVNALIGTGDGHFLVQLTGASSPTLPCCSGRVLADFNGDGVTDAVGTDNSDVAEVFLTGGEVFAATVNGIAVTGTQSPQQVVATYPGDVNFSASTSSPVSLLVEAAAPVFTPASGAVSLNQTVTLSSTTPNAPIYWQATGANQTSGFTLYTGPIEFPAAGNVTLQAYSGDGVVYGQSATVSTTYTITSTNPVPLLGSLTPAYTPVGSGALTLSINGTGFTDVSVAYWGNTALSTQYVNPNVLTVQVPSAQTASAGVGSITVQTAAPGGGTSNVLQFEVDSGGAGTSPSFGTSSATVAAGGTASYPVTLPASATNVSVNCLNLPSGATCSYSQGSGALAISTSASTPAGTYQVTAVFTETVPVTLSTLLFAPFLLFPLATRVRNQNKRRMLLTSCLLLVAVSALISCGGGSSSGPPPPPQTHQVTSSGVVNLTVQ
jgi:hypothetical protein